MLFSPEKLGNIDVKNRFIVAPMTRVSANPDGTPNNEMQNYYVDYALGGFGLIITEGTYIDELHSQGYETNPELLIKAMSRVGEKLLVLSINKMFQYYSSYCMREHLSRKIDM